MHPALQSVRFLSRLRIPADPREPASFDLAAALGWAPLAGMVITVVPALVLSAGVAIGLPGLAAAVGAFASAMLVTGGLHEDGLADVADGFGGGFTLERKLSIMRDSRIGTYGTLALIVAVTLRVTLLAAVIENRGVAAAVSSLFASAALSRAMMLFPMTNLPPARPDGLARSVGTVPRASLGFALVLASVLSCAVLLLGGFGVIHWMVAGALSTAAALAMTRLSRQQIGGVTGDVVGATQQVAEIAVLIALSAKSTAY